MPNHIYKEARKGSNFLNSRGYKGPTLCGKNSVHWDMFFDADEGFFIEDLKDLSKFYTEGISHLVTCEACRTKADKEIVLIDFSRLLIKNNS